MSTIKGMSTISDVSAFIIAGGKGSRFGGDKLNYVYRGKPLIAHVADVVKKIFSEVALVADDASSFAYLSLPCYADLVKNIGSIVGILTAISYSNSQRIFAVAGDMPSLNEDFIRFLAKISEGYDVTVPIVRGNYEPLHAVYSKNCEKAIRAAVKRGERRIVSFFGDVRVREVTEEEMHAFAEPETLFYNINYKEDIKTQHG